jgi:hypothetical protein
LCKGECGKADGDENYIGAVCRFNGDDDLIVMTRNDEYKAQSSTAKASSDKLKLKQEPIRRLKSVREKVAQEASALYEHSAVREQRYWEQMVRAIESGQTDYTTEARIAYNASQVKYPGRGLPFETFEAEERQTALRKARDQLARAIGEYKRKAPEIESSERMATLEADKRYEKLHGTAAPYPNDYVEYVDAVTGGHAEENLIRVWGSATSGLDLKVVELFITRMPCPDKSSGLSMGGVNYKEGCLNKLIQLVSTTAGVQWEIAYYQHCRQTSSV